MSAAIPAVPGAKVVKALERAGFAVRASKRNVSATSPWAACRGVLKFSAATVWSSQFVSHSRAGKPSPALSSPPASTGPQAKSSVVGGARHSVSPPDDLAVFAVLLLGEVRMREQPSGHVTANRDRRVERSKGSPSVFSRRSGIARLHQTQETSLVISPAVTALANSANSASGVSPVSQRTQYGSACPNRTGPGSGSWSRGTPEISWIASRAAWSAYSAAASPSTGLRRMPLPVLRQIPSTGTSAPSHTVQGAAPCSACAGNWAYRRVPETRYTIDDVADGIAAKLVRRHPHVFGDVTVLGAEQVKANWDEIKRREKADRAERAGVPAAGDAAPSALDGVPFGQPPWR